jgi:hypothetical protein
MIKLIDLLKEDSTDMPNVLYHFTTPENFIKIINSDKIKAHSKFNQISFTEDADLWAFQEHPDSNQEIGIRLKFQTDSLPPVKPFLYKGAPGEEYNNEQEWITTSGDIDNIEGRIIGSNTLELTALEYWKGYLKNNTPPHIFRMIEFT